MATPSDIINPGPVSRYARAVYRDLAVLTRSGAARVDFDDPQVNQAGGQLITLRSFAPDTTASTKNDGVAISSPPGPSSIKNVAIISSRVRVRKVDAPSTTGLANDEKNAALDQLRAEAFLDYWPRETERCALSTIKGVFGSGGPLVTSHTTDLTSGSGKPKFNFSAMLQGSVKLGDNRSALKNILIHSKALADWEADEAGKTTNFQVTTVDTFLGPMPVKTYRGYMVFETDQCPVDTGGGAGNYKYSTFLVADGALAIAIRTSNGVDMGARPLIIEQTIANPPSIQRSETVDFATHVYGTKWNAAYPADGPDTSDLETGSNWAMADNAAVKDVRIVKVLTY